MSEELSIVGAAENLAESTGRRTGIFFVLIFLLLAAGSLSAGFSGSAASDILTPEERSWIAEHQGSIVLAVETGYAPFLFIDSKGTPAGLGEDYMHLLELKLGVQF